MYTRLSTTAVSPFLYCFTMSWWVSGSLRTFSFLFFGLGAAAFRVDRARRGNVFTGSSEGILSYRSACPEFKDGLGIDMTMKTFFTLHITSCEKHGIM